MHTILVVEDVDEISSNMIKALRNRGHNVERAANAKEAIEMAEANRPTMILTDLELPTFDSLMHQLRQHGDLKSLLVAIIDINNPKVQDHSVNVLRDFQALDDLIESSDGDRPQ
jgi:CheY-like chemotaxis protein